MTTRLVVFDAYGTLFDVAAAARNAARESGGERLAGVWSVLARDWRERQLRYTWLRAVTGAHVSFDVVTAEALDWALDLHGLAGDAALRTRLLALYRELEAYPEVPEVLAKLRAMGARAAILSNGSPEMLAAAVTSAGLDGVFEAVLSVEAVKVFKPSPLAYGLVAERFGLPPRDVLFVSANGWDAGCGAAFGFKSVWVNRVAEPVERLPGRPGHILSTLERVADLLEEE